MNKYSSLHIGDCDIYADETNFSNSMISYGRLVANNICNSCPLVGLCLGKSNECIFYNDVSGIINDNEFVIDIYSRGLVDVAHQLYDLLNCFYGDCLSMEFISKMNDILSGELAYLLYDSNNGYKLY